MTRDRQLATEREVRTLDDMRESVRMGNGEALPLFQRPDWFALMHQHCFADSTLHIAQYREGDASVWLPMVQSREGLNALANWYSFSVEPVFVGPVDEGRRQDLLLALARDLRRDHYRMSIYPVLSDATGSPERLLRAFRAAGWVAIARHFANNHCLHLQGRDFTAYWAQRPGALRTQVKRKGKKSCWQYEIHRDMTDALWADYIAVYAKSWKVEESHPAFLHDLARDAGLRGALRLGFARAEGRPIAAQLWTIEGDTALIHKMAHDSAMDALSPGTLLSHHMFAAAIDGDKVAHIDYGSGDNDYKRLWMEGVRPMMRIDCFNPRAPQVWPSAARTVISRLVRRAVSL